jgi:hypothetical protein
MRREGDATDGDAGCGGVLAREWPEDYPQRHREDQRDSDRCHQPECDRFHGARARLSWLFGQLCNTGVGREILASAVATILTSAAGGAVEHRYGPRNFRVSLAIFVWGALMLSFGVCACTSLPFPACYLAYLLGRTSADTAEFWSNPVAVFAGRLGLGVCTLVYLIAAGQAIC